MMYTSSCETQITIGGVFFIEMSYVYLVNHFDIIYKRENEICFSKCVRAY